MKDIELDSSGEILNIPNHVAIIMDGNNRWTLRQGLPGVSGHKAGIEAVREIVKCAMHYRINALTLFAFSTDNWKRPPSEVNFLMKLLVSVFKMELKNIAKHNIRLSVIGNTKDLTQELQHLIEKSEYETSSNNGLNLNIAINYGGRWDILNAAKSMAKAIIKDGISNPNNIQDNEFTRHLSLSQLPDVDLCVRTSGECRISNFLLWQLAYSELIFVDTLWPDFRQDQMNDALREYSSRKRNFGARN